MSSFLSTTFSSVPYVLTSICFIRVTSLIVLDFKANNGLVSLCLTKKISCNFMEVFEHSLKREVSQTWNRHTNFHLTSHSVIARSLLSFTHSELSYAFTRTTISIECKDFRRFQASEETLMYLLRARLAVRGIRMFRVFILSVRITALLLDSYTQLRAQVLLIHQASGPRTRSLIISSIRVLHV